MPAGRPTDYTPELAERICDLIAVNPMSIKKISAQYDDIPSDQTIFAWISKYTEFSRQYLEAKEKQALAVTDALWNEVDNVKEKEQLDIFDRKFRFHQWHLSKLAPKQFGDKKEVKTDMNLNMHEQDLKHLK